MRTVKRPLLTSAASLRPSSTPRPSAQGSTAPRAHASTTARPTAAPPPPHAFFGVYDGHGGSSAAQHLASRLHLLLAADLALWRESPREAMLNAFALAESELRQVYETNPEDKSGSCACVGMLRGRRLVVASVARVVLCGQLGFLAAARFGPDHC